MPNVEPAQYAPVFAQCTCGCNSRGWFVCGVHGWRSQYASNLVAAQCASNALNQGRISEQEVDALWSIDSDWTDLLTEIATDGEVPAHLH